MADACRDATLADDELWLRYFGLGGVVPRTDLTRYLSGNAEISDGQYDVLAHAVNECLGERGLAARVPYLRV
ncbi:MAG: hypothetical protein ABR520_02125 [Mycobacteriales bacterium]|nr:hypothetical protein [Frankia sp.]